MQQTAENGKPEKDKMLNEEPYFSSDPVLVNERQRAKELCYEYNHLHPKDKKQMEEIINKLFGKTGKNFSVKPMFYCDYGYNIYTGDNFRGNHNLILLDICQITFGNNVYIGPNCGFYTAGHPINVQKRNSGLEFGKKITIGNNVWFGGNCIVLPGVTIGNNVTIGAGSVVTRDIPSNVTAYGNPCKSRKENPENADYQ